MEVELVLLRLGHVQDLHVAALHADGQPLPRGTVAQREDLGEKAESEETGPCPAGSAGEGRAPRGDRPHPLGLCGAPYLGAEVVLLKLAPLPQVPAPHRVIQPPRPQLGAVVGDIDAAGAVRVALELPGGESAAVRPRRLLQDRVLRPGSSSPLQRQPAAPPRALGRDA